MIQHQQLQRSIFEAAIGSIAKLIFGRGARASPRAALRPALYQPA